MPAQAGAQDDGPAFFEKNVRPVLVRQCLACHSTPPMGGLRLDSREKLLKGGTRGPAMVPGKPAESRVAACSVPVGHAEDAAVRQVEG